MPDNPAVTGTGRPLDDKHYEHACLLALSESGLVPTARLAGWLERAGSASALWAKLRAASARWSDDAVTQAALLGWLGRLQALTPGGDPAWDRGPAGNDDPAWDGGPDHPPVRMVSVLDEDFPDNLRRVRNRPAFVFVRGRLEDGDWRAVAVVGTRRPTPPGRAQAARWAGDLARAGVVVVSGLALGIDTEAHQAALAAGGRTIACLGTGIDVTYPPANSDLALRIARNGACVTQFCPGTPPRRENFPRRNVVTSAMAVGTLVVEASARSGARMQARLALEHGKRLYLPAELVRGQEWAAAYAERPGVLVVEDAGEVVSDVDDIASTQADFTTQLRLV
ncbi:MAG: DNA-processing protein DprA [Acidimicrobiales bacterium]